MTTSAILNLCHIPVPGVDLEGSTDEETSAVTMVERDFIDWVSRPPGYTVLRINTSTASKESIIDDLNAHLKQEASENGFSPGFVVEEHAQIPDALLLKVIDRALAVQPAQSEIVVDPICGAAVLRGADVFAPGVIGAHAGLCAGTLVSIWADLEGHCLRGSTAVYAGQKRFLGNGQARMSRAMIFKGSDVVKGVAVSMTQPIYLSPRFHTLPANQFFPQNLPSILVGHVLAPVESDLILDMCAAPGGKTTHIASLMKDRGCVVALDRSQAKIDKIQKNAAAWGLSSICTFVCDSARSVLAETNATCTSSLGDGIGPPPYAPETFDKILVDAPCSGLGQRPRMGSWPDIKQVTSYPPYQRQILRNAVSLLKRGGTLLYSTCTLPVAENEANVAWLLKNFADMSLVGQRPLLGQVGYPCEGLEYDDVMKLQRFDYRSTNRVDCNEHDTETIGFFIAKFKKI